ncbi:MAG: GTPase ObgE [Dehalococcoidales bacterium]|jgi:GTP-binding protein|nr:GTPase ObgE [Dehalococcoidales bacterium]MDP6737598.1 GTPase ObgE [Dehalococcoidales bacterium]|tara:strand:+ start:132 stop:1397 length:1266 start_codon:yes stop_codon:yes gene_type:complete
MFDRIEIRVKAGKGGDGAVSFRREKFVPFGGPDGGDGGDGGDVILVTDPNVTSLARFRYMSLYQADNGRDGRGRKQHGKKGADLVLRVPLGTLVWDGVLADNKVLITDLSQLDQDTKIARGGNGGWGNTHFVSSTNQAPRLAQKGEAGEERSIILEIRLIADAGIIGYPNVGKSSLLTAASAAKPKIASYPFTTLEPILGVVMVGLKSLALAEIPGLIEGAHLGRGLGHDFLRHAMRTKILIHLIDGTSVSPVEDVVRVNTELGLFEPELAQKPQTVAVNKIDLPAVQARLGEMKQAFYQAGMSVFFVSAVTGEGVGELMEQTMKMLIQVETRVAVGTGTPQKVFRPRPRNPLTSVRKEGDAFVIAAPELERVVARVDVTGAEVRRHLRGQLDRLGVARALVKAGVKPGDKVRCGHFEWEW